MGPVWDGLTRPESLGEDSVRVRQRLAAAAKDYDWPRVLAVLSEHPELVNTTRPARGARFAVAQDARRADPHLATTRNPGNVK